MGYCETEPIDHERKMEVLKFTDWLRAAGVTKVTVTYSGDGDEGFAEPPEFQDAADNPIDESNLPAETEELGELLACFAPDGYECDQGGHGTITFDVQTGKIRVEHNNYEIVSNPDDPWEI